MAEHSHNPQADLIGQYISENMTMLTNAQLPDVWEKLKNRGYSEVEIGQKLAELAALRNLNEAQRKEYGEQYQSTANYNAAQEAMHGDYEDHLGYARLVFKKDLAASTALGLGGRRHRSQSGYAAQALLFYNNLLNPENAAWQTALGKKGVSADELAAQQSAYSNLATLEAAQQKETGEAQAATKKRDAAYDALREWTSEFRATAKIALRKYPQMMEQLGIKDGS